MSSNRVKKSEEEKVYIKQYEGILDKSKRLLENMNSNICQEKICIT